MVPITNVFMVIMGLLPIIVSALKVEKYYTSFYIALWNLYGTCLVILGYILDPGVPISFIMIGIISIIIIILAVFISYVSTSPNIIRYIGKSIFTIASTTFYSVLFFYRHFILSASFAIFALLYSIIAAKIVHMRDSEQKILDYGENKRKTLSKRTVRNVLNHQDNYYWLRIILVLLSILNLIINLPLTITLSFHNPVFLSSVGIVILFFIVPLLLSLKSFRLISKQFLSFLRFYFY